MLGVIAVAVKLVVVVTDNVELDVVDDVTVVVPAVEILNAK